MYLCMYTHTCTHEHTHVDTRIRTKTFGRAYLADEGEGTLFEIHRSECMYIHVHT